MGQRIDLILVPQGAEYQAVCRGIGRAAAGSVLPIPIGSAPLRQYLHDQQKAGRIVAGQQLLVMGLCGGLIPRYAIADVVLYRECVDRTHPAFVLPCDTALTDWLHTKLTAPTLVRALTSDRLVSSAQEKRQLAQDYAADVVDMEGFAALDSLYQLGATVAMLRVVSDNAQHDLPNLANAIDQDGALQPLPLAWGMVKQPIAAARLMYGSLKSLNRLQRATTAIFGTNPR
ncbi:phosphorylase [Phormidium sp. FACHB-592]|uniref:Phosphorylase n=1 Tax=Stenomitos frigidus AS-A4 TaxID=2933935 RepID=A0ABV0KMF5_9CYAN|nr:phosphorylase [Phormidium sp. FACHB-592]MBD2072511.1 phosphorylase [Phormidium sp. FACHB-592]